MQAVMAEKNTPKKSEAQYLKDPAQIRSILKRIQESHALLSLSLPNSKGTYSSSLINVIHDDETDVVELDELTPSIGHDHFIKSREARVYAKLNGVDVRFSCHLKGIKRSDDGYLSYVIDLPRPVEYHELRSYFRVPISLASNIQVTIELEAHHVTALISDISQGGFGAVITDSVVNVSIGDVYPCTIQLSKKEKIECSIEIRNSRINEFTDKQHIGAQFHKLTRAQELRISNQTAQLQREMIRKNLSV